MVLLRYCDADCHHSALFNNFTASPVSRYTFSRRILIGLIFSCLGDGLLVWREFFLHGMLAFGVGHIFFISAFGFQPLNLRLGIPLYIASMLGTTGVVNYLARESKLPKLQQTLKLFPRFVPLVAATNFDLQNLRPDLHGALDHDGLESCGSCPLLRGNNLSLMCSA